MNRFLIGFAEGVIAAAAVFAALVNYASAEPCFPSEKATRAATHASWVSWTDRFGPRRYYAGHPNPRVKCDDIEVRQAKASVRQERPKAASHAGARPPPGLQTSGLAQAVSPEKDVPVSKPAAPAETTGTAAAGSMTSTWTEEFYPLLQGREHAQFIPAVLTITETRIAEKRPETTVISLREPSNLRSEFRRDMLHLLAGILAIVTVIGLGTFLVGEIQAMLLRTREARR